MFRTPSPGDSISVALRKLLQGDGGEVRLCRSLQQREQEVWTSKIKYLKNLAFCVWEDYSFHMQLSYHGRPVSFFTLVLAFPQLLSNLCGRWWQLLDCSFESPHSHLGARNRWRLWHFLFIDTAGDIFISHKLPIKNCITTIAQPWRNGFLYIIWTSMSPCKMIILIIKIIWQHRKMLGKTEGRRRRGNRGWDDWMALPTQWTWVWANSGR